MPKLKTKKTFSKRFKITVKGKVVKRSAGQGHYNARSTGDTTMRKRRGVKLRPGHAKTVKKMINR